MSPGDKLADLAWRLEQVENALADAQARVPGLRAEVRAVRHALGQLGEEPAACYPAADARASDAVVSS